MTPLIQLIPREPFGRADIQKFATKNGWTPVEVKQPEGPIEELAWALGLASEGTDDVDMVVVHWVEDRRFHVDYLAVEGEQAEWVAGMLRDALPLHSDQSLSQLTANTRDETGLMRALRKLGIHCAGRTFDGASYDLLRWALHDPEPLVRRNALLAVSILDWPELVPLLTQVSETEKDATVQQQAATTLDIVRDRIARRDSEASESDSA